MESSIIFYATPRLEGVSAKVLTELVGLRVITQPSVVGKSISLSTISEQDEIRLFTQAQVKNINNYYNVVLVSSLLTVCELRDRNRAKRWLQGIINEVDCFLVYTCVARSFARLE